VRFGDYSSPQFNIKFVDFDPVHINPDYATLLTYSDEFYRVHCPAVAYYELDKKATTNNSAGVIAGSNIPSVSVQKAMLWGEQVGGLKFARQLNLQGYPSYSEGRKHQLTARGLEIEQLVRYSVGMLELQRKDIFPQIGDQFQYLGLRYSVLDVYIRPEDIFQQTGLPLHVTIDSVIYRFGDSKKETIRKIQEDPTILRGYIPPIEEQLK
jgi:hypothetical protein